MTKVTGTFGRMLLTISRVQLCNLLMLPVKVMKAPVTFVLFTAKIKRKLGVGSENVTLEMKTYETVARAAFRAPRPTFWQKIWGWALLPKGLLPAAITRI